jgi:hypothetical protein
MVKNSMLRIARDKNRNSRTDIILDTFYLDTSAARKDVVQLWLPMFVGG